MKNWNIYIGILSAYILWNIITMIFKHNIGDLPILLVLIGTVYCLYNYSSQKGVGRPFAWKALFVFQVVSVVSLLSINIFMTIEFWAENSANDHIRNWTISSIIIFSLLPAIYGTYKYAFKSNHLWESASNDMLERDAL